LVDGELAAVRAWVERSARECRGSRRKDATNRDMSLECLSYEAL
jgi:hypothetical protein